MIRNVVMGRLRDPDDPVVVAQMERGVAGIVGLKLPGLERATAGRDTGLRDGGWHFAIVNDFTDADAYRAYDKDPEHNEYRAMIVEVCADVARVQFEI